jgi:hypothetical protein
VDTPARIEKLQQFIGKISARRLVNSWHDRESLKSKVIISLSKAFSASPRVGWVRADTAANEDILSQVVSLRNQIDVLSAENTRLKAQLIPIIPDLAPLTNIYKVKFHCSSAVTGKRIADSELNVPWDGIFATVGPAFFQPATDVAIRLSIVSLLAERFPRLYEFAVYKSCLDTIKIQLIALGFLETYEALKVGGGVTEFMRLTDLGKRMLIEIMAVRAPVSLSPEQTSRV